MADRIELRGLTVRGNHGVFDRRAPRRAGLRRRHHGVDRPGDRRRPATTSPTRSTTARWPSGRPTIVGGPARNLIETVAGEIAEDVMTDERVHAVEVVVHKPAAPIPLEFADVAVVARRSRRGGRGSPRRERARRAVDRLEPGRPASPAADRSSTASAMRCARCRPSTRPTRGAVSSRRPFLNAVLIADDPDSTPTAGCAARTTSNEPPTGCANSAGARGP